MREKERWVIGLGTQERKQERKEEWSPGTEWESVADVPSSGPSETKSA